MGDTTQTGQVRSGLRLDRSSIYHARPDERRVDSLTAGMDADQAIFANTHGITHRM